MVLERIWVFSFFQFQDQELVADLWGVQDLKCCSRDAAFPERIISHLWIIDPTLQDSPTGIVISAKQILVPVGRVYCL